MAYSTSSNSTPATTGAGSSSGLGVYKGTYKGFSTLAGVKSNQLYDLDLIKQDLINHFYTRKGERVMEPDFGSVIWDMLYEPMDETNKEIIVDDCKKIIISDPRVDLRDIYLTESENGLRVDIGINVKPFDQSAQMLLEFERETI